MTDDMNDTKKAITFNEIANDENLGISNVDNDSIKITDEAVSLNIESLDKEDENVSLDIEELP